MDVVSSNFHSLFFMWTCKKIIINALEEKRHTDQLFCVTCWNGDYGKFLITFAICMLYPYALKLSPIDLKIKLKLVMWDADMCLNKVGHVSSSAVHSVWYKKWYWRNWMMKGAPHAACSEDPQLHCPSRWSVE